MHMQDPGIIPDPALRQKVRTQHGAHLEEGFRVLQIALQIDPDYSDAMAYMNLLYRIESAITDTPEQSAAAVQKADEWVQKALAAKRRQMQTSPKADGLLDADGPAPGPRMMAPPPPPPPPPPGRPRGNANEGPVQAVQIEPTPFVLGAADVLTISVYGSPDFGGQHKIRPDGMITMPFLGDILAAGLTTRELSANIKEKLRKYIVDPNVSVQVNQVHSAPFTLARRIPGEVLQKALVRRVDPVHPSSGAEGEVRLSVAISKDGRLHGVSLISAPSEDLARAAMEAVKQWEFRPEMLSDPPADVISTVSIWFARH
jgi:TonB family protein